jgi:hypothetical protein
MQGFEYYSGGSVYLQDVSDPFNVFQGIIYDKGAYVLHMLRHVLGDDLFFESLHTYATDETFKYKLATTEDFQSVCEQVSGIDLTDFFDQWVYDTYYPKYEFDYYQDESFNTQLGILQKQGDQGWREIFNMPLDIKFEFSDGTETTVIVQNNEVYQTYSFSFQKEIATVSLDPDNWVLKNVSQGNFNLSNDESILNANLVIYPNPIEGILNIRLNKYTLKVSNLYIFNSQNTLIEHIDFDSKPFISYSYDTSKLSSGVYFLKLQSEEGLVVKKFIVA